MQHMNRSNQYILSFKIDAIYMVIYERFEFGESVRHDL